MRSDLTFKIFGVLLGLAFGGQQIVRNQASRAPASVEKPLELNLQNLTLDPSSKLKKLDHVFVRAIFNKEHIMEFGKNENWTLNAGETRKLDLHIEVQPSWVKSDELEFKLEIVQQGMLESTLVRCSTISKSVTTYNRAYQCTIPGENSPLLTYRLAAKGAPEPSVPKVATNLK